MSVTVPRSDEGSAPAAAELVLTRDRLLAGLRTRAPRTGAALARRVRELDTAMAQLRGDAGLSDAQRRMRTLVAINEAIAHLQALPSTAELIEAAPEALCRSCGFSRAMISRVRGSMWVPEVLHTTDDAPDIPAFSAYVDEAEIPLEHLLLETDLVRRRVPVLVLDAPGDARTFKGLVEVADSRSYAAAPIMPTRRVIGFLHVDRRGQAGAVDAADRDNLWAFAEHFGLLFERAILVERLERQRSSIHTTLMDAAEVINELCDEELALARHEHPTTPVAAPRSASGRPSPLSSLLSAREREVLELVASGATNTAVAELLVISQGTVKSHVKRILRKLHVANRAEAVARYLQLLRLEQDEGGR